MEKKNSHKGPWMALWGGAGGEGASCWVQGREVARLPSLLPGKNVTLVPSFSQVEACTYRKESWPSIKSADLTN